MMGTAPSHFQIQVGSNQSIFELDHYAIRFLDANLQHLDHQNNEGYKAIIYLD